MPSRSDYLDRLDRPLMDYVFFYRVSEEVLLVESPDFPNEPNELEHEGVGRCARQVIEKKRLLLATYIIQNHGNHKTHFVSSFGRKIRTTPNILNQSATPHQTLVSHTDYCSISSISYQYIKVQIVYGAI